MDWLYSRTFSSCSPIPRMIHFLRGYSSKNPSGKGSNFKGKLVVVPQNKVQANESANSWARVVVFECAFHFMRWITLGVDAVVTGSGSVIATGVVFNEPVYRYSNPHWAGSYRGLDNLRYF